MGRLTDEFEQELEALRRRGLLREREAAPKPGLLDICTNDYLGYATRLVSRETSAGPERAGAGASRLIHGTQPVHEALEREVADWTGSPAALLFTTAYAANVGVVSALARAGDLVVSDALNHASIVDGCRLSKARVVVTPHLDLDAVDRALAEPVEGRRWVVCESYYSMDADGPDPGALRALCDRHDAGLIVDEAHALGVFGPEGGGLMRAAGVQADVMVGAFGKAVGVQGGFAAAHRTLLDFLWNRARSFVFSTAPSPVVATLALEHVKSIRRDDRARARLAELCDRFSAALRPLGMERAGRWGPIFPLVFGSAGRALEAAQVLEAHGFRTQPIRPPTVPEGTSRLRVALRATMTDAELDQLIAAVRAACGS